MQKRFASIALAIVILFSATAASAKDAGQRSWEFSLKSDIIDLPLKLQVKVPWDYHYTTDDYATLYYLDGDKFHGYVNNIVDNLGGKHGFPKLITIGIDLDIGHRKQRPDYKRGRVFIMTPTRWDPQEMYSIPIEHTGGAPLFLKCIEEEIIPLIESQFRAKQEDRSLIGHSFAGLFSLFALFEAPGLFSNVIAASPSIWWDGRVILESEERYHAATGAPPARLFSTVGGLEIYPHVSMVEQQRAFGKLLQSRDYETLSFKSLVNAGEHHVSNPFATYAAGLRWLLEEKAATE